MLKINSKEVKYCANCQKELKSRGRKFCSQRCCNIYYSLESKKSRSALCKICGSHFHPVNATHIYCSSTCVSKAYRQRKNRQSYNPRHGKNVKAGMPPASYQKMLEEENKRERALALSPDLSKMQMVQISPRSWIAVPMSKNADQAKNKYIKTIKDSEY